MSAIELDLRGYDPMAPAVQQNPFPYYAALRDQAPVFRHEQTGIYFISRMDTVSRVLADTDTFSSRFSNRGTMPQGEISDELRKLLSEGTMPRDTMLTLDPPAQTRYRKTVGRAFSTRRIQALEPVIRSIAADLIEAWPTEGPVDFMNDFAVRFPVKVISHMLNMNPDVEDKIKLWSDASVAALGVRLSNEERLESARRLIELQRYWIGEFEERLAHPRDDFLSALSTVEFEDEDGTIRPLEMSEKLSIINQLMVAGNETTTKFLNETIKLLIENPDEWRAIQEDPLGIPNVVEEGLRLSSPNQGLFRIVRKDVELEGVKIAEGSTAWVMFGSANRDERIFPDSDRFDPSRPNLREHVAFGRGAHFCIGAPLARLEGRVAFEELSSRIRDLSFAPGNTFEYEPSYILRGLKSLRLQICRS